MKEFEEKLLTLIPNKSKSKDEPFKVFFALSYPAFNSPFYEKEIEYLTLLFSNFKVFRPDQFNFSTFGSEESIVKKLIKSDVLFLSSFNFPYISQGMTEEILRAQAHDIPILTFRYWSGQDSVDKYSYDVHQITYVGIDQVVSIEPFHSLKWYAAKIEKYEKWDDSIVIKVEETKIKHS